MQVQELVSYLSIWSVKSKQITAASICVCVCEAERDVPLLDKGVPDSHAIAKF